MLRVPTSGTPTDRILRPVPLSRLAWAPRGLALLVLAPIPTLLALDRGEMVGVAAALGLADLGLHGLRHRRHRRWAATALGIRYGVLGPILFALLALGGAPGEAVVLAVAWFLQCLLALGATRAAAPLLAGAALLAFVPRPEPPRSGVALRVATWNVEWGKGGVPAVASMIRSLDADVIALQEIVDERNELRVDLMRELQRSTGLRGIVALEPHPDHGSFGTGILSRLPLSDVASIRLPLAPRSGAHRIAIRATVEVGGRRVTLVSAHLDRPPHASISENLAQARAVRDWIGGLPSVVLCGDFNALPVYPSHALLRGALTSCRGVQRWPSGTWPAPLGLARLDWVFVRGLTPLSQRVIHGYASDHLPVVVDLVLADPGVGEAPSWH